MNNHTQAQADTYSEKDVPRLLFWLGAIMPALSFMVVPFSSQLSQLIAESSSPFASEGSFLYVLLIFVVPSIVVPSVVAFVITLAFPVVADRRNALLFAIPALIIHLYIYSIEPFLDPWVVAHFDFRLQLIWTLSLFLPLGILSFASTAFFSRLGSRIRGSR